MSETCPHGSRRDFDSDCIGKGAFEKGLPAIVHDVSVGLRSAVNSDFNARFQVAMCAINTHVRG